MFSDGAGYRSLDGVSQTSCPFLGATTTNRCVVLQWQAGQTAYNLNRAGGEPLSWFGTVLESRREGVGLEYKRIRYYDPQSGHFTQGDPTGVAGGLNAYGFGSGDPINLGDPFGMCPKEIRGSKDLCYKWNQQQVSRALETISEEDATGNGYAVGRTSDQEEIVGINDDELSECKTKDPKKVTKTGCSGQSLIWVNADRPPEAIAATIAHERQHLRYRGDAKHDEGCAKYVAAMFGANMLAFNRAAASLDPYFYTNWSRPGGKCY